MRHGDWKTEELTAVDEGVKSLGLGKLVQSFTLESGTSAVRLFL
jgi:hypothetical protein